jgi:hypothetical protein
MLVGYVSDERYLALCDVAFVFRHGAQTVAARSLAGRILQVETAAREDSGEQQGFLPIASLEVIDILGKPQSETSFQSQSKWVYPDLTVIFDNGRVKEVRF